jgi:methyl-accepting chemotaxis protein
MRNALHEVTILFQLRWMARVAGAITAASLGLLFVVRKVFLTKLDQNYGKAVQTMRAIDDLLLPAVGFSVLVFLLVSSVVVAAITYFLSHRLAWPIFRAELFAEGLHRGDLSTPTFVRHGDQLRGLATELERLHGGLESEVRTIGEALERMELLWEELDDVPPEELREQSPEIFRRMQQELDAATEGRHRPAGEV